MSSQNRVAVITGGSTGIGKAAAAAFAKDNARVAIVGRRDALGAAAGESSWRNFLWFRPNAVVSHWIVIIGN